MSGGRKKGREFISESKKKKAPTLLSRSGIALRGGEGERGGGGGDLSLLTNYLG